MLSKTGNGRFQLLIDRDKSVLRSRLLVQLRIGHGARVHENTAAREWGKLRENAAYCNIPIVLSPNKKPHIGYVSMPRRAALQ